MRFTKEAIPLTRLNRIWFEYMCNGASALPFTGEMLEKMKRALKRMVYVQQHEEYEFVPNSLSVSELINPVRLAVINRCFPGLKQGRATGLAAMNIGNALHAARAGVARVLPDCTMEKRVGIMVPTSTGEALITGQFDALYKDDDGTVILDDLKSMNRSSYGFGLSKPEAFADKELQLRIYNCLILAGRIMVNGKLTNRKIPKSLTPQKGLLSFYIVDHKKDKCDYAPFVEHEVPLDYPERTWDFVKKKADAIMTWIAKWKTGGCEPLGPNGELPAALQGLPRCDVLYASGLFSCYGKFCNNKVTPKFQKYCERMKDKWIADGGKKKAPLRCFAYCSAPCTYNPTYDWSLLNKQEESNG